MDPKDFNVRIRDLELQTNGPELWVSIDGTGCTPTPTVYLTRDSARALRQSIQKWECMADAGEFGGEQESEPVITTEIRATRSPQYAEIVVRVDGGARRFISVPWEDTEDRKGELMADLGLDDG